MDRSREPLPTRVEETLELPAAYHTALETGLDALSLTITPTARAAIDGHARLLVAWTSAINLTAIRDPSAVALGHIVDSLTALALLRERGADRMIDLGSGGGYPGFPLAAAFPMERALLIEPIAKKVAFLSVVATATGQADTVEAAPVRAEALAGDRHHRNRWPVVTARAVASLAELIELAFPLLAPGGCLVAWKRGDLGPELAIAERAMAALGGGTLDVQRVEVAGLEDHRLVVATSRTAAPPEYPRDPATRKRRPWSAVGC